ncbi:glycosyltransferase [Marinicrinis lubricantis]|uniref:Glycosyltransferase n=1 Tax=Marinicrinis lubricantis TaxID=2086470 RepID=A0ABW1IL15_9BACL
MKVLHLPLEVGNQVSELCRGINDYGETAIGFNWRPTHYLGYDKKLVQIDSYEMASHMELLIHHFDIFHYHTGYTIFEDKTDILHVLDAGKKVIMHHRGNDVRIPEQALKMNPYVYTGDSQPTEKIIQNLQFFSKHISTAIVQDLELYDYVSDYYEKVYILPRIIDTSRVKPIRKWRSKKKDLLVVHAPTSRRFKGTSQIIAAVEMLQKEIPFQFRLLEQMSRQEIIDCFHEADIVIDQILCGAYGNVSVEAMALGKPVICYIRPDIEKRSEIPIPVASAHPEQLYYKLKLLLTEEPLRKRMGKMGRKYVEKVHDRRAVIPKLLKIYRELLDQ